MWILVVGAKATVERPEGGAAVLAELGCRVRTADLWDALELEAPFDKPPAAVLVEALERLDAARAAVVRLRGVASLIEVPVLVAITVDAIQGIQPADAFDDFVLVPYVPAELYMRVRRAEWRRSEFIDQERIKIGALCIDLAAHEVLVDSRPIELTHQEFSLLRFLSQNRGRVYSRDQLLERVWGVDYYGGSRTVDIHVRRLRMKLGAACRPLQTVRGVGYKMKAP